jgi:hypothetical protein
MPSTAQLFTGRPLSLHGVRFAKLHGPARANLSSDVAAVEVEPGTGDDAPTLIDEAAVKP